MLFCLLLTDLNLTEKFHVFAVRRRLFWINSKYLNSQQTYKSSIQSSTMAGKDMKIVIDRKIIKPVGLCADTVRRRLYWYDIMYRTISTCKYDGRDFVRYPYPPGYRVHLFNLAVHMVSLLIYIALHNTAILPGLNTAVNALQCPELNSLKIVYLLFFTQITLPCYASVTIVEAKPN